MNRERSPAGPRRPTWRLPGLAAAVALILSGCTILSPPRAFLLPPVPAPVETVEGLENRLVAVERVSLPAYVADGRIAVLERAPDGEVALVQSSGKVWADTPERALTLALADAVSARTGAAALAEPLPVEAAPEIRVGVVVSEAVGSLSGPLTFRGDIRVSDMALNGLAIARSFEITVDVEGEGMNALTAAHSVAIGLLADEIAGALAERFAAASAETASAAR